MGRAFLSLLLLLLLISLFSPVLANESVTADAIKSVYLSQEHLDNLQNPAPVGKVSLTNDPVTDENLTILIDEKATVGGDSLLEQERLDLMRDESEQEKSEVLKDAIRNEAGSKLLKLLGKEKIEHYLVQFNRSCDLSGMPDAAIRQRIETDRYVFMAIALPRPLLRSLIEDDCVIKVADPENQDAFFAYAHAVLKEEMLEKARKLRFRETSDGVTGYPLSKLDDAWDKSKGEYSPLQAYVTPTEPLIKEQAKGKTPEELYYGGLNWLWISDEALWGKEEVWVTPKTFLTSTRTEERNPAPGTPASDCSEQANTLVSLLRASGIPAKKVRVVIGEVYFDDNSSGGHAWVELYEDGSWIVIDATVGEYYDDEAGEFVNRTLPFDYWRYHDFPIVDVWAYYNDKYFLDLRAHHAPGAWDDGATTLLDKELRKGLRSSIWERFIHFLLRILGIF